MVLLCPLGGSPLFSNGTRFERDFKSFELQVLGGGERKHADTLLSTWDAAGPMEPERGRCMCPGQAAINHLRPKETGLGREARLSSFQWPDLATEISPQRIKPALCLGLCTQDVKEGRGWGQGVLPRDHACRGIVPLPHTQKAGGIPLAWPHDPEAGNGCWGQAGVNRSLQVLGTRGLGSRWVGEHSVHHGLCHE